LLIALLYPSGHLLLATRLILDIMRRFNVCPQQPCPGSRERVSARNRVPITDRAGIFPERWPPATPK